MLSLPLAVRIFVYTGVTDMRRSFDHRKPWIQGRLMFLVGAFGG